MAGKNVTIGNVNISMSANAANLIKQTKKADQKFGKIMKRMIKKTRAFSKSMAGVAKSLTKLSSVAGIAGAAGFAALAIKTYEAQREMQRMSDVAGVSMGKFTQMSHITNSLGLQTEYLADGMKDLNVRIVDAAKGGGTMVDFFALMGESAQDWVNLKPDEQLDKFIEVTGKLSDNDAKFWGDEVNDSMYRLGVTLRRSGKTMKEFQEEAKSFGAGTSSLFIGSVNGMYESFARLSLLVNEFKGTTFALLANSFGAAFEGMTGQLKKFIGEGDNVSENIFNMSKSVAIDILTMIDTIYTGIHTFINKALMLLGKFDSSFTDGLYSVETIAALDKLETRITDIKDTIEAGTDDSFFSFNTKLTEKGLANAQAGLKAVIAERDKLLSNTGDSVFTGTIDTLITNLKNQTFALAKAKSDLDGSSVKTNSSDPAKLMLARKYLKDINLESTKTEDSKLKQILMDKEHLEYLLKHYDVLIDKKGTNSEIIANQKAAHEAIAQLDKDKATREDEISNEKIERERTAADKILEIHKNQLSARLAFDAQYGSDFQAMTTQQQEIEQAKLLLLRQQNVITTEEHGAALLQLSQDKINSEIHMEMDKLAMLANGLQAFTGKSETLARAAFAFTQGKALQETIVQQAQAVSAVWADSTLPWYTKAGTSLMAAAQVGSQIQTIKQAGQFHDGGEIPYDGTYYMEGGEMVIPKDRVGEYIDSAGEGGGGGTVINSTIQMGANLVDEKVMAQALAKQQTVLAALVQREGKKRPSRSRR